MLKKRVEIPKTIRDRVLKEFNYRCAICGTERPQVHHIDENPSNNEPLNLIPLCPNCHLIDQHNPTAPMDEEKLQLFRKFKDPSILKPQFHPLFLRMKFLMEISNSANASHSSSCSQELVDFIAALEMGSFYSKRVGDFIVRRQVFVSHGYDDHYERERLNKEYIDKLIAAKETVISLLIELLRYQSWPALEEKK